MRFLLPLLLMLAAPSWGAAPEVEIELNKGQLAWDANDHANALVHWALALKAARADGDDASEFDLLLRLASTYRVVGKLDTAAAATEQAAELARNGVNRGRVLQSQGQIAMARGDARRAEKLFQQAFRTHRDTSDPQGAANSAVNLGVARTAIGDLNGASKALVAAAGLFDTLGDHRGRADALTNLAVVQRKSGQLPEARKTLEAAVELYRGAGDLAGEADALTNLGLVLQDLGRDEIAKDLYEAALKAARQRKDVRLQASLLTNLGTLAHAWGDGATAVKYYRSAEGAFADAGMDREAAGVGLNRAQISTDPITAYSQVLDRAKTAGDGRIEAMAALNLASLLLESKPADADKYLVAAESGAKRYELPDVAWRAAYLRGQLELNRGKRKAAIVQLRRAVDSIERTRRTLDRSDAQQFVLGKTEVYETLIDALLAEGDSHGAFLYAQRLQMAQLPPADATDETAQKYQALAAEEERLVGALSSELNESGGLESERAKALRKQLDGLRVEFAETVDELRASNPNFDRLVRVDPEDLEAVQRDLDPGVVVLQPVMLEDKLVLLVFTKDKLVARTVEVEGHAVAKAASRLARMMQADSLLPLGVVDSVAQQLGEWLIAPIQAELEGAQVLVVSATGPFRQIPFGMLRHNDRYLVQDIAVVGVTHVGSLRKRATLEKRFHVTGDELLLVGNPDGSLPGAEEEVALIAHRFEGSTTLVGSEGTRAAVFEAAHGKSTVHLATHGRIDPEQPTRSHLVLAGGDEGRLSYREIPGLAPYLSETRLVVLSACESGRPVTAKPDDESEEVVISINGLSAQFRRAGVETMVASLWKVDDEATRTLMGSFYAELAQGSDIGRALQKAQVSLLANEATSHPDYWGAFVVMGDWR